MAEGRSSASVYPDRLGLLQYLLKCRVEGGGKQRSARSEDSRLTCLEWQLWGRSWLWVPPPCIRDSWDAVILCPFVSCMAKPPKLARTDGSVIHLHKCPCSVSCSSW